MVTRSILLGPPSPCWLYVGCEILSTLITCKKKGPVIVVDCTVLISCGNIPVMSDLNRRMSEFRSIFETSLILFPKIPLTFELMEFAPGCSVSAKLLLAFADRAFSLPMKSPTFQEDRSVCSAMSQAVRGALLCQLGQGVSCDDGHFGLVMANECNNNG